MDFIIAATEKNLMMVEGEAKGCDEADLVKALEIARDAIRIQVKAAGRTCVTWLDERERGIIPSPATDEGAEKKVYALPNRRYEAKGKGGRG